MNWKIANFHRINEDRNSMQEFPLRDELTKCCLNCSSKVIVETSHRYKASCILLEGLLCPLYTKEETLIEELRHIVCDWHTDEDIINE